MGGLSEQECAFFEEKSEGCRSVKQIMNMDDKYNKMANFSFSQFILLTFYLMLTSGPTVKSGS